MDREIHTARLCAVVVCLFSVFCFSAVAAETIAAPDIGGGIIYPNKDGELSVRDFKEKKSGKLADIKVQDNFFV